MPGTRNGSARKHGTWPTGGFQLRQILSEYTILTGAVCSDSKVIKQGTNISHI